MLRHQYPDVFATAWIGIIDKTFLTYASAGHTWPLLQRTDGEIEILSGSAPPLGLLDRRDKKSWDSSASLGSVKALVLYTDGLTEMTRNVDEGERALHGALLDLHVRGIPVSASVLKERLVTEAPADDIAILTVGFEDRR